MNISKLIKAIKNDLTRNEAKNKTLMTFKERQQYNLIIAGLFAVLGIALFFSTPAPFNWALAAAATFGVVRKVQIRLTDNP